MKYLSLLFGIVIITMLFLSCTAKPEKSISINYIKENDIPVLDVYDTVKNKYFKQDLEEYTFHVLCGEMFASYDEEALKAQACAVRSFALFRQKHGGCGVYDVDICTDYHSCLAYLREEEFDEKWSEKKEECELKIKKAVNDTKGEVIVFDDKIIFAIFHSNSGGKTEDIKNVFGQDFPYLISVEGFETPDSFKYSSYIDMSKNEFEAVIKDAYPEFETGEYEILSRTYSGRTDKFRAGNIILSGTDMRELFCLNSAMFDFEDKGEQVVFSVKGYGHGVGLSQAGAQQMALDGKNYSEITSHYYSGTQIKKIY